MAPPSDTLLIESPVKALLQFGQSPWLDFIGRSLLTSGKLERMMSDWGLRGITSNPVIFEKAIAQTDEYQSDIEALAKAGSDAEQIYETLAIRDVQMAADILLPVYEETDRADGFVSFEVAPHMANDAKATIDEARRLWPMLGRPNIMLKVPGTEQGLTAIRTLLADGMNVNVTLLFSVTRYREVLTMHLEGLENAAAAGQDPAAIASVASFFLSRIDTLVDAELDKLAESGDRRGRTAVSLRGETAIASARRAYEVFEQFTASPRFRRISERGARPQRLLWASTGTKDASYSDIKYVEALVGQQTVNTMPLETLQAYDDHGAPALQLPGNIEDAAEKLRQLSTLGIDLDEVTAELLRQGINKFIEPYDSLIKTLEAARLSAVGNSHSAAGVKRP
ncbi:MAG: transaldolase [Wenzhouxiangellaceae bacterium]